MIGSACPPAFSMASAAVWIVPGSFGCGSAVFASRATFAPSAAARSAIASPMPRLPPDIRIVLPAKGDMATLLVGLREAEAVLADEVEHHLAADRRDPAQPHGRDQRAEAVLGGEAVAAVGLDGLVGRPDGDLGG